MGNLFIIIMYVYFGIGGIAAIYFNYLYAVNNGFWAWIFFGEIIATLQGFIWPYYIFFN